MENQRLEELLAQAKQLTEKQKQLLRKTNRLLKDLGQPQIKLPKGGKK